MSCPDCYKGRVRTDSKPTGRKTFVHGLDCYVATPAGNKSATGIIVIVPDAFGWSLVNNQLLADEYARQGNFEVYLPDFMNGTLISIASRWWADVLSSGNNAPLWMLDELESVTDDKSIMGILTKPYHLANALYGAIPFLYANRLKISMPRVTSFLAGLRKDSRTASLPIGVAGFCWGGPHIVRLCWDEPELAGETDPPPGKLIDCAFTAHPSNLSVPADIEKVRKPLCIAAAGADKVTPVEQMQQAKQIMDRNGVLNQLKVYEGAGHGWSVRLERTNLEQKAQAEDCESLAVKWFTETFASLQQTNA